MEPEASVGKQGFVMPLASDMHTHLRQGKMTEFVTPMVRLGGCRRVLVMPNTEPPITTCAQAAAYREKLQQIDNSVEYLMTLYLSRDVSAEDLKTNAKACHVVGVKSYPRGVTTNSENGVESYEDYYSLFEVMSEQALTLHLHGEVPGAGPLEAEELFLPTFEQLHSRFPSLRIVLEHVSTASAIRAVRSKPPNVAATITPHHLMLTIDDVLKPDAITSASSPRDAPTCCSADAVAQPHNFCKPLAKTKEDREALRQVVRDGDSHFFLGSDSAPHPRSRKEASRPAAGVFTQPLLLSYLADFFTRLGCIRNLRKFTGVNAAKFFGFSDAGLAEGRDCAVIEPSPQMVPDVYLLPSDKTEGVVPFMAGQQLQFTVTIQPYDRSKFTMYELL
ncbi:dihydroorotase [Cystoisospora suis]|uniref:Dihydroorotase n=1 Tax=Cystoisospora suis TaxID=483139 RepID=A0A2C6KG68_9APIC|nr:dihydroorotase [Cystoisospora suis]